MEGKGGEEGKEKVEGMKERGRQDRGRDEGEGKCGKQEERKNYG